MAKRGVLSPKVALVLVENKASVPTKTHITNTSNTNLAFGIDQDSRTGVCFSHQYDVRDSDGIPYRNGPIKHPELGATGQGWPARVLMPGESMDIPGDHIGHLYELSRPGEYTIQL